MDGRIASAAVASASLAALMFGCPNEDPTAVTTAGGPTGNGGGGGNGSSSQQASSSSIGSNSSSAGTGGEAGAFNCDPPAAAGSLFELSGQGYVPFAPISMCKYRGDVMLIFNDAAE